MINTPPITADSPAQRCVSFASTLAVVNAIVTSLATAASPVVLTGAGLTGATAGGPFTGTTTGSAQVMRSVTVKTSASAATYATGAGNAITVTGTDAGGNVVTDTLVLANAGGNETVSTTKGFLTVTSISIPAQLGTGGSWQFGVQDVVGSFRRIRVGTQGNVHIQNFADTTQDVIPSVTAGETLNVAISRLYGDSNTTASNFTLER